MGQRSAGEDDGMQQARPHSRRIIAHDSAVRRVLPVARRMHSKVSPPLSLRYMKPKKHQRLGDESEESQHLAQNPGGDEAVGELSIEAASPGRQTPSTPRHERKRCCGKRCKVGCAAIWLLIGWWLVSLLIQYPNSDFWAKEIMQSETVETILYILSPANRRTYDAIKAYYDSQRPLILESARHFEANKAWVADMHLDGYKQYYYYDVVSLRTFMMERRWLADPRNDDFLWEKDKCVMYSWFRRNGFPFTEILREWHDIRGTAEQAVDLVSTDMRNRSGHSQYALGSSPVTYPSFLKCCHITQGHLKSTHIVHNEAALEAASGEGLREWMVSHWDQRPNDYGRTRSWLSNRAVLAPDVPWKRPRLRALLYCSLRLCARPAAMTPARVRSQAHGPSHTTGWWRPSPLASFSRRPGPSMPSSRSISPGDGSYPGRTYFERRPACGLMTDGLRSDPQLDLGPTGGILSSGVTTGGTCTSSAITPPASTRWHSTQCTRQRSAAPMSTGCSLKGTWRGSGDWPRASRWCRASR